MSVLLRVVASVAALVACGATGFVVGWSSVAEGGLEDYYRSGLLGLAGGLLLGLLLLVAAKEIVGRRRRSGRQ